MFLMASLMIEEFVTRYQNGFSYLVRQEMHSFWYTQNLAAEICSKSNHFKRLSVLKTSQS